jgi:alpha-1,3/alpha-1,6-mannosyltransferase
MSKKLRIAFLHPDLGLGGAERLVVDCAVGLAKQKHFVHMFTSHYDKNRSFSETRDGFFDINVHGDWLPRHCCQFFHIFFAILRNIWLALCVCCFYPKFDIFVCDQISICIPFLRFLSPDTKILFYCHFPDQLLSKRTSFIKKLYRMPFDLLEQVTTGMADQVVVNSEFTKGVYRQTFTLLKTIPSVLYPCVPLSKVKDLPKPTINPAEETIFLSINRFERKKSIHLCIEALIELKNNIMNEKDFNKCNIKLIIAGGYDERVKENRDHFNELKDLAEKGGVLNYITWKRAFTDEEKPILLANACAILYTPTNEHFGIVPIECMASCKPVIACASGGPLESVADGKTGYLCEPNSNSFANAMLKFIKNKKLSVEMGTDGRKRVEKMFSRDSLALKLNAICNDLMLLENISMCNKVLIYTACFFSFGAFFFFMHQSYTLYPMNWHYE